MLLPYKAEMLLPQQRERRTHPPDHPTSPNNLRPEIGATAEKGTHLPKSTQQKLQRTSIPEAQSKQKSRNPPHLPQPLKQPNNTPPNSSQHTSPSTTPPPSDSSPSSPQPPETSTP